MKAFGVYIILSPVKTDTTTKKGIILDNKTIRFREGIVQGGTSIEGLEEGARVIYDSVNAHETMVDNNKYLISKIGDIAIII